MKFVVKDYHHNVPDEEYISDMQKVAQALGVTTLTKKQYDTMGRFSSSGIEKHFGGWRKACERAEFILAPNQLHPYDTISKEVMIEDLRRVFLCDGKISLTASIYDAKGKFHSSTICHHFGSWNQALIEADLPINLYRNISVIDMFSDIQNMWVSLGRQPTTTDVKNKAGKYSMNMYRRRFGGWREALKSFVEYVNQEDNDFQQVPVCVSETTECADTRQMYIHKTSRDINLRLRFKVLARDNFSCCSCGSSPAKDGGITRLHVDHIIPWSKGGETVYDNLQTLCEKCNLGKCNIEVQ